LTDKLPEIIQRNIANLMSDSLVLNPQVESDAHYYSRKIPFDGLIQWDWTFDQIERFVRALRHPQYTGASVLLGGYKYEITDIQRIEDSRSFNIVSPEISNGVIVGRCADACLAFSVSDSTSSC
jgi:methionyl-tRNA formyltransferase